MYGVRYILYIQYGSIRLCVYELLDCFDRPSGNQVMTSDKQFVLRLRLDDTRRTR